jgi:hypothetical protein
LSVGSSTEFPSALGDLKKIFRAIIKQLLDRSLSVTIAVNDPAVPSVRVELGERIEGAIRGSRLFWESRDPIRDRSSR